MRLTFILLASMSHFPRAHAKLTDRVDRTALISQRDWFNAQSAECQDKFLNFVGTMEQRQQVLIKCTTEIFKRQNSMYPGLSSQDIQDQRERLVKDWRAATGPGGDPKRAALLKAEIGALNERYVQTAEAETGRGSAAAH